MSEASPGRDAPRQGASGPGASERGAEVGRRIGVGLMYGLWKPRVLGSWRVPVNGPVILAVNHSHNVDGPMVMGVAPRPAHFLIKKEAFIGPLGTFLDAIGQVRVDRSGADRTAITRALGVLQQGGVLGIFPEGTRGEGDFASLRAGLAYFAVRSGAPIVPVAVLEARSAPDG
ncbi:1-acyl-sn-glycerol-3-phosphate acyltransferase OS=Streptomyces alboniger OX=132473 GN=CP975_07290 PE=4 SV=1 [Streptomyces alboniger]